LLSIFVLVTQFANMKPSWVVLFLGTIGIAYSSPFSSSSGHEHIVFQSSLVVNKDSIQNIHIEYASSDFIGDLQMTYGNCESIENRKAHHFIGRTEISTTSRPARFVWIVPEDAINGHCLHAFSGEDLVGRSAPITVEEPIKKREVIADVADIEGPWFDGVAYMKSKNNSDVFVAAAKNKSKSLPTS
jgi:hypothetical protein